MENIPQLSKLVRLHSEQTQEELHKFVVRRKEKNLDGVTNLVLNALYFITRVFSVLCFLGGLTDIIKCQSVISH